MDDEDLYDEFGNLIGDPLDSDAESVDEDFESDSQDGSSVSQDDDGAKGEDNGISQTKSDGVASNSTALVHGTRSEEPVMVTPVEEETGGVAVIEPEVVKKMNIDFDAQSNWDNLPELTYDRRFMVETMEHLPERVRNIAVVGNFHCGKTSFIDLLVLQTHPTITSKERNKGLSPVRFMDTHKLEIDREMTIKTAAITLMLPTTKDKSYILNILDTPGHTNFIDETTTAVNNSDGIVVVLDSVEGLTNFDKKVISLALQKNLPIILIINKIDRLLLELKLPPPDCYHKLKYIIDETNQFIANNEYLANYTHESKLSPSTNNVIFASSIYEFTFTLASFAKIYLNARNSQIDPDEFSQRLWGDNFYNTEKNSFVAQSEGKYERSFIKFVLNPIYKVITQTLTFDPKKKLLSKVLWSEFGITLTKHQYKQDIQLLLRDILRAIFVGSQGFVELVMSFIDPPHLNSKVNHANCPLLAQVIKLVPSSDAKTFLSLIRIYNGSVSVGSKVKVLGENYLENDEDFKIEVVEDIFIPGGRYKVPVTKAQEGSIVLVSGIDSIIAKSATIVDYSDSTTTPLKTTDYTKDSVFKVAIEPAVPSELPKLLDGLRKVSKSYLASLIKVEESGEHVVLTPGELHMDCALHDLRLFFTDDLEIKVSDPMTKFSETCSEMSMTKISSSAPNGHSMISVIAEPIADVNLSMAIEAGKINLSQPIKTTSKILRKEFGWDALAARSVWCFGPDDMQSPTMLLDDTLEGETDKKLLYSVKDSIALGFRWAVNEGPLCDEPIRNTKFKILDAVLSSSQIQRSGTQIIPMTRKACYTGFLTASPRLMEPMYFVDVTCSSRAIPAISKSLEARRGYVTSEYGIPGTPLYHVEGYVPVIDSPGLETDIRLRTQGQAMCFLLFHSWEVVPGDPLDKDCFLPSLKPVPTNSLARDFVMKTRRRKGLSGEPILQKYIDADLYQKLLDSGLLRG
jgi:U5 small nuclear ribonucleoprotein component